MTRYTSDDKPIQEADVSAIATMLKRSCHDWQGTGADGLDVSLGVISGLRMFVLHNVGPEGVQHELDKLAEALRKGF